MQIFLLACNVAISALGLNLIYGFTWAVAGLVGAILVIRNIINSTRALGAEAG